MRTSRAGSVSVVVVVAALALSACGGSSEHSTPGAPACPAAVAATATFSPTVASSLVGTYTGTWTSSSFGINGTATITVTNPTSTSLTFTVAATGPVYAGAALTTTSPLTANIASNLATFPTTASGSYIVGTISGTMNADGTFLIDGTYPGASGGFPSGYVMCGTIVGKTFSAKQYVTFTSGGAAPATTVTISATKP